MTKPAYRVPLMAELGEVEPNGYTLVSTFSGCGGSCLGFRMAGFRPLWANEFIPAARETYEANSLAPVDPRDVREITAEEILDATGLAIGELDVLEGSPPCASFSTAGRRSAGWGEVKPYSDSKQRVDDLFFEYVRLVRGLQPRVFVAENVSGLVKGVAKGYFNEILRELKRSGYRVGAKVLDAMWLGVPQQRQRIIFVGVREDLSAAPAFPTPLPYYYSVRDALSAVERFGTFQGDYDKQNAGQAPAPTVRADQQRPVLVEIEGANGYNGHAAESIDDPMPTVQASRSISVVETGASLDGYAVGDAWDKTAPGHASERFFSLQRPHPDRSSPTITALGGEVSVASVTHPTERRKFSIAELRRVCSFPDDFVFTGTYAQQWERMGRAVPPLMMRAVAEVVRDEILRPLDAKTAGTTKYASSERRTP